MGPAPSASAAVGDTFDVFERVSTGSGGLPVAASSVIASLPRRCVELPGEFWPFSVVISDEGDFENVKFPGFGASAGNIDAWRL